MAITEQDIRLYQSQRMTDNADGGGSITATVIVDGQDNNLFPDVTDLDWLQGRVNARKLYGSVASEDTDTYLSAHVVLDDDPDDAAIDGAVLAYGNLGTQRAALASALAVAPFNFGSEISVSFTGGADLLTYSGATVGDILYVDGVVRSVIAVSGSAQVDAPLPGTGSVTTTIRKLSVNSAALRCYGCGSTSGSTSSGVSQITVDNVWARVVPYGGGAYPIASNAAWLVEPEPFRYTAGRVRVIAPGDLALVSHTKSTAPATVTNGQTVNVSRTDLARLRVIRSNGVEHARFTAGVTPPSGVGCTADLAAGTVTFSDVSGLGGPVTIEDRIEQLVGVSDVHVGANVVLLNQPLGRTFPAGTKVSSLLMLGDLQGRVGGGFAQSTWTSVWSDSLIGSAPLADFAQAIHPITVDNKGAVTERWLALFTSTSSYRLIGETLGEVGVGSTGVDFSPANPVAGVPYMTLPAAGWGTGWASGNAYRFNTYGAQAALWALRCVTPGAPSGSDSVSLQFRGYINT